VHELAVALPGEAEHLREAAAAGIDGVEQLAEGEVPLPADQEVPVPCVGPPGYLLAEERRVIAAVDGQDALVEALGQRREAQGRVVLEGHRGESDDPWAELLEGREEA
jgi:hypothetical protein